MYLQRTSIGPLVDEDVEAGMRFLMNLKKTGQLPGWSKDDQGEVAQPRAYSDSVTVNIRKKGDASTYHYKAARAKDGPWTLQRAWRTDRNDHTIEDYLRP